MPEALAALDDASVAQRFLTLWIGERFYALRAEDVTEVILLPTVARVPQSPGALLGLANLRGEVIPVASLRELLGLKSVTAGPAARAIVLDVGAPVALVVDAVDSLVSIAPDRVEVKQAALSANPGEQLIGAFESGTEKRVAKIIDIRALLEQAFANRTRPERQPRLATTVGDAKEGDAGAGEVQMLVTFEIAGQEYALALDVVQEILPAPESLTVVPRTEALVLGVTSVRETLLPLLSLRGLLGFPPSSGSASREKVVVMNFRGAQVGLVTDRARAIVAANVDLVEPIPAILAARTGGEARIKAIYRGEGGRRLISILAPEQIFREEVMQRLSVGREKPHAAAPETGTSRRGEVNFLVFRLGGDEFGLPIDTVDEVAQVPAQITRVPKTPKFLEGVVNLRGDVLPVVDQRRRFDMPALDQAHGRRLVVVKTERHRAGLIVDSVSDVLRVSADAVEPPPNLTDDIARLVSGVINLDKTGRIILLLDPAELLTRAERGLLDAFQKETARKDA